MLGPVLQGLLYRGFAGLAAIGVMFMGDVHHQRLSVPAHLVAVNPRRDRSGSFRLSNCARLSVPVKSSRNSAAICKRVSCPA